MESFKQYLVLFLVIGVAILLIFSFANQAWDCYTSGGELIEKRFGFGYACVEVKQ